MASTYHTHTTGSLAGSWKESDCPGTGKCGGGDGGRVSGGRAGTEDVLFYKCGTKLLVPRKGGAISWLAGGIRGDVCVAAFNLLMRKIYPSCLWWGEFRDKHDIV